MRSIEFLTSNLTSEEAQLISDAYFRSDKDPAQMARLLGVVNLDLNLLTHPYVKREIIARRNELAGEYSLKDHLSKLKEIRDGAFEAENWKVALTAEVSVGKAAGLYEPRTLEDSAGPAVDPALLSTDQLRKRLAQVNNILTAPVADLPDDPSVDDDGDGNLV